MRPMQYFLAFLGVVALAFAAHAGSADDDDVPMDPALKLRLEFQTEPKGADDVHAFFVRFARVEGLSFEDAGAKMPPKDGRSILFLALRKGDSIKVIVTNVVKIDQFLVAAYEYKPEASFDGIATRLTAQLKEKWPSTKPYKGL